MWRAAHGNGLPADNGRSTVVAENYTLLLRSASYFVDSGTRNRVLEARRLGSGSVSFRPAIACDGCSCQQTVTIRPDDVLGFIAHDNGAAVTSASNVIPFRAAI
jgi:hypothetical protein